eukprot:765791-Hanusia_phi.AAC.2
MTSPRKSIISLVRPNLQPRVPHHQARLSLVPVSAREDVVRAVDAVILDSQQELIRLGIPHDDVLVARDAEDVTVLGVEDDEGDARVVPVQGCDSLQRVGVPEDDDSLLPSRRHVVEVAAEHCAEHGLGMPTKALRLLGGKFVQADAAVEGGGQEGVEGGDVKAAGHVVAVELESEGLQLLDSCSVQHPSRLLDDRNLALLVAHGQEVLGVLDLVAGALTLVDVEGGAAERDSALGQLDAVDAVEVLELDE